MDLNDIFEVASQYAQQALIYWNRIDQNTQLLILGGTTILIALLFFLRRRNNKKWLSGIGSSGGKPIYIRHQTQSSSGTRTKDGFKTGNRKYDNLVDYYSIPGTYEKVERKKKRDK